MLIINKIALQWLGLGRSFSLVSKAYLRSLTFRFALKRDFIQYLSRGFDSFNHASKANDPGKE